ncbi:threonine-phosphate decarboxylase CobD [Geoalkalibacter halelectricus]|uniref:threonine-phosphate decarboxylase n=1 Tax=Geoalkalibacter halelectricus TaxID=2847045 RepID=A0ABY5ZU16_9BACT|nr:threonine-phosphate decarboxylase CobD [Geoalkalibacter halelectricus]MDO3377535.1 threonine-phosphate decarboxylase CobD [Geoalkalibacter halelectricus]UWZ80706.1 threonine-phosphate decarboxylase CobD [Geoalkalibacter halelectricus]
MQPIEHGGNILQTARELGVAPETILDFSASINPLGVPETVMAAVHACLAHIQHYPEIAGASLTHQLATHHGLPATQFVPGNGSTELIYLLPRVLRPRRALLLAPCFGEYARSLTQSGCAVDPYPLRAEEDFLFDPLRLLHQIRPDTDLVVLANPGNPAGTRMPAEALLELADGLREQALVLVDEAFMDFCPEHSLLPHLLAHANLLVLRSLTKFYAIAGLRAGYLAGPAPIVARLAEAREPWTLSTPGLAAARACLDAEAYRRRTLELIPQWRDQLRRGLQELRFRVFPGQANYLLAHCPPQGPQAPQLAAALREQGLLIRDCSNFVGLDARYLRVAVRLPEENRRLLQALRKLL